MPNGCCLASRSLDQAESQVGQCIAGVTNRRLTVNTIDIHIHHIQITYQEDMKCLLQPTKFWKS